MERAVVCKGDATTHGGKVIEGNEDVICDGRPVALKGCMTYCPKCGGNFPIIEGAASHGFFGDGTVLHNMLTGCGARVLASQDLMTVDDGTTGDDEQDSDSNSSTANADSEGELSGGFRAVSEETGAPFANVRYRIELSDGRVLEGVTNNDGVTERLSSKDRATAKMHLVLGVVDAADA